MHGGAQEVKKRQKLGNKLIEANLTVPIDIGIASPLQRLEFYSSIVSRQA